MPSGKSAAWRAFSEKALCGNRVLRVPLAWISIISCEATEEGVKGVQNGPVRTAAGARMVSSG